jgi:hypothetical protein
VIDAQWLIERISPKAPFHRCHPDLDHAVLLALGLARLTQVRANVLCWNEWLSSFFFFFFLLLFVLFIVNVD